MEEVDKEISEMKLFVSFVFFLGILGKRPAVPRLNSALFKRGKLTCISLTRGQDLLQSPS